MKIGRGKWLKKFGAGLLALLLVGILAAAFLLKKPAGVTSTGPAPFDPVGRLELQGPQTIGVPKEVKEVLGLMTETVIRAQPRPLELLGETTLDTDRLVRIRLRFPAKVIEITQVADHAPASFGGKTNVRPLGNGDPVKKDQILAVVYSTDLGQQKSTLVDTLSQLRLDEAVLKEYEITYSKGALPERDLMNQRRQVEQDRISADKAENTLRSWEVPNDEIESLKDESVKLNKPGVLRGKEQFEKWARMEVRAPFEGTIVEKNATLGEFIDPGQTPPALFQIADRNLLTVLAYAGEDDLPQLEALPKPIHWTIRLNAEPTLAPLENPTGDPQGPTIDQIIPILDPFQHSPVLIGTVKNPGGKFLSNMAVKATIQLPSPPDWVQVPAAAVIEDGDKAFVFVQPDPQKLAFKQQRVAITRHYRDVVFLRSRLTADEEKQNAGGKGTPIEPLQPGQQVVISSVVELEAALEDLQTKASAEAKQK